MRSLTALSAPAPAAPPRPARPHLRLVPPPRGARPQAASQRVAALAAGMVLGFLLVALVSAPLGLGAAAGDLRLAGLCAVLSVPAFLRARAVARRAPTRRGRRSSSR
jgi:predicted lipid-binding transport protein (Tim44 family)